MIKVKIKSKDNITHLFTEGDSIDIAYFWITLGKILSTDEIMKVIIDPYLDKDYEEIESSSGVELAKKVNQYINER